MRTKKRKILTCLILENGRSVLFPLLKAPGASKQKHKGSRLALRFLNTSELALERKEFICYVLCSNGVELYAVNV